MNYVTAFTTHDAFLPHGLQTLRELRRNVATSEDSLHAVAIVPDTGIHSSAKVQMDPVCAETKTHVTLVKRKHVIALAPTTARLLAFDYLKVVMHKLVGLKQYVFLDADISCIHAPLGDLFSISGDSPLRAAPNSIHDPRNEVFYRGTQVDNGLLCVHDAEAAYARCREVESEIVERHPEAFYASFTPGLVIQSQVVHDGRGLLPQWLITNWHDLPRVGRTCFLHHTGPSKQQRYRVRWDSPVVNLHDIGYTLSLTPEWGDAE